MLNQILISYPYISNTIYIIVRDKSGNVWNISRGVLEVWDDSNLSDYVVNSTYKGGNLYVVDFPLTIPKGYYTIQIIIRSGLSPAITDLLLDGVIGYWNKDDGNLLSVRVDNLVEYSDGERFTAKALEEITVGEQINIDHSTDESIINRSSDPTFPIQRESNPS